MTPVKAVLRLRPRTQSPLKGGKEFDGKKSVVKLCIYVH